MLAKRFNPVRGGLNYIFYTSSPYPLILSTDRNIDHITWYSALDEDDFTLFIAAYGLTLISDAVHFDALPNFIHSLAKVSILHEAREREELVG